MTEDGRMSLWTLLVGLVCFGGLLLLYGLEVAHEEHGYAWCLFRDCREVRDVYGLEAD